MRQRAKPRDAPPALCMVVSVAYRWMLDSFGGRSIPPQEFQTQGPALIEDVELEADVQDVPCAALGDLGPDTDFPILDSKAEAQVFSDFQDLGHGQHNVNVASDDWLAVVESLET